MLKNCRNRCPEQCSKNSGSSSNDQHFVVNGKFENQRASSRDSMSDLAAAASEIGSEALPEPSGQVLKPRSERDVSKQLLEENLNSYSVESKEVGLSRVLNVVSKGDLAFSTFNQNQTNEFGDDLSLFDSEIIEGSKESLQTFERRQFCVSGVYFFGILMTILLTLLLTSSFCVIFFLKHRCALRKFRAKNKFSSSISSDHLYSVPPSYDIHNYRK